jgi:azurin
MFQSRRWQLLIVIGLVPLLVTFCGRRPADEENEENGSADDGITEIVIEPMGDTMQYATTTFKVKAGEKVRVVINNVATSPAMVHNVVILKSDADKNAIGLAGIAAGEAANYVPEDPAVLFHTALAKPGEKKSVEFTAPPAGSYPYICTFPGHYASMQGTMISE